MYQPDEALAAFEIPTVRETRDQDAPPFHGCPDEPGRECMMRHLYARKKNQAVKCAHCGIMAARVSNFYKAKERAEGRQRAAQEVAAKVAVAKTRKPAARKKAETTEEQRQRRREIAIANLAKANAKRHAEAVDRRGDKKPRYRREPDAAAIARAKQEAERRKEILAEGRRLRAEATARRKEEQRQRRLELQSISAADRARAEVKAEMQDVRDGHKNPSRVQGVVLILEWYLANAVGRVSLLDFSYRYNAIKGATQTKGGVLGRSLRRYGLKVRSEYNEALRGQRVYLYLDDTARKFVEDEFVFHTHARGRLKR